MIIFALKKKKKTLVILSLQSCLRYILIFLAIVIDDTLDALQRLMVDSISVPITELIGLLVEYKMHAKDQPNTTRQVQTIEINLNYIKYIFEV